MVRANTLFKYVCYHLEQCHIITSGTDHKIGYYDKMDGSNVRELEGSTGSINTLDISANGKYFVSGGDDKLVKVCTVVCQMTFKVTKFQSAQKHGLCGHRMVLKVAMCNTAFMTKILYNILAHKKL